MRPLEPSEPPDATSPVPYIPYNPARGGSNTSEDGSSHTHRRSGRTYSTFAEDTLSIDQSRVNEFPPDPDAVLYGSYASLPVIGDDILRRLHDEDVEVHENGHHFRYSAEPGADDDEKEEGSHSSPTLHENGIGDLALPGAQRVPNGSIHADAKKSLSVEDSDEEPDSGDEEEDVKAEIAKRSKSAANALRGKAAARLPQRAAAMASRTTRNASTGPVYTQISGDESVEGPLYEQDYEVDEEVHIQIAGHEYYRPKAILYYLLCIFTGGLAWLVCRWVPRWELTLTTRKVPLCTASIVAVTNQWNQLQLVKVRREPFSGTVADVFRRTPVSKDREERERQEALNDWAMPELIVFDYRYVRFMFNPAIGKYEPNLYWRDYRWTSVAHAVRGLQQSTVVEERNQVFGRNAIDVEDKSTSRLLMDEILHPFSMFQIASIILWSLDDYYFYAACIFLISVFSTIVSLMETRATMRRLRELSRFVCEVRVFRKGVWRIMRSDEIIPGDVFEVNPAMSSVFPCDGVLLDGDCIVNESMLTGESVPVSKTPLSDVELRTLDLWEEDPAASSRMSRFFVFAGTKIIRARPGNRSGNATPSGSDQALNQADGFVDGGLGSTAAGGGALALAVRTGFNTTKGSLVRSMLFPKPNNFKFYRDSFRFIGVLAIIAMFGFIGSLYNFIRLGVSASMIIIRALDLITIVVPPALPATMAIGTSFAIARLRKGNVYCTSPPRVNICGKLDLMAFDKTGTLTEEGLDVLGFRFTVPSNVVPDTPIEAVAESDGPLRFSALYKTVEEVIPPGALNHHHQTNANEFVADRMSVVTSPVEALSGVYSSSGSVANNTHRRHPPRALSVALGSLPGHPNGCEPDFPYPLIVCAMSTCHSIKVVNGELIGDPMDVKMFEFTGWQIEESTGSRLLPAKGSNVASGNKIEDSPGANPGRKGIPADVLAAGVKVRPPRRLEGLQTELDEGGDVLLNTELGIVRSFEFNSGLRRMSVVVHRLRFFHDAGLDGQTAPSAKNTGSVSKDREYEVFVKGAPEVMRSICLPASLPADYDQQLADYAHHGYRVIACAWRRLENVPFSKLIRMRRDAVERDLQFLGFIVFENKLKPGTAPVVEILRKAKIRQVMCTGDNVLTAISVSRECGLVDPSEKTFVPRFVGTAAPCTSEEAVIVWEDVDGSGATLDSETLLPNRGPRAHARQGYRQDQEQSPPRHRTHSNNVDSQFGKPQDDLLALPQYDEYDNSSSARSVHSDADEGFVVDVNSAAARVGDHHLAVTGDVFQWMLEFGSDDSFNRMLAKGEIYARMSPDQKHFLVENFQELGYCTGFCGDGANDCGALKSADVGLSLSEAEASVAAPFTSTDKSIECVLRVIREGRAALVTSFSCFKYMALYSLIQFTTVSLLYSLGGNLGDFQFLAIDLALIIPIAVCMGRSGPHPRISRTQPTASLVSRKVLTSLIGQVLIQVTFQVIAFVWVRRQPWYEPPARPDGSENDPDEPIKKSYENTAVFVTSLFQYIFVAVAFCVGAPYRQSMWKNVPFLITVTTLVVMAVLITMVPMPPLSDWLELEPIPTSGHAAILALAVANGITTWVGERWILPGFASGLKQISVGLLTSSALAKRRRRELDNIQSSTTTNTVITPLLLPDTSAIANIARRAKRAVKRTRWKAKGKIYKIVLDDMRMEIAGVQEEGYGALGIS
ncbi:hypothetical protein DFS34DRAFT_128468 [Phlyctochytrium arcticum]|nr:hypothetical protein DFS34DRAFT_128468 [Phlyctochytrium arcticum]